MNDGGCSRFACGLGLDLWHSGKDSQPRRTFAIAVAEPRYHGTGKGAGQRFRCLKRVSVRDAFEASPFRQEWIRRVLHTGRD